VITRVSRLTCAGCGHTQRVKLVLGQDKGGSRDLSPCLAPKPDPVRCEVLAQTPCYECNATDWRSWPTLAPPPPPVFPGLVHVGYGGQYNYRFDWGTHSLVRDDDPVPLSETFMQMMRDNPYGLGWEDTDDGV